MKSTFATIQNLLQNLFGVWNIFVCKKDVLMYVTECGVYYSKGDEEKCGCGGCSCE